MLEEGAWEWEVPGDVSRVPGMGRGLVPAPQKIPKSEDAHVPSIKWHSTVGPRYLRTQNPPNPKNQLYVILFKNSDDFCLYF